MNLLFDLISTQGKINGGAEYAKTIFNAVLRDPGISVECVFDSAIDLPEGVKAKVESNRINLHDIRKASIEGIVRENRYDKAFFPILQRYIATDLSALPCAVIGVWHDVRDLEIQDFRSHFWQRRAQTPVKLLKSLVKVLIFPASPDTRLLRTMRSYGNMVKLCQKSGSRIVVDSEHTKNSIRYFFPKIGSDMLTVLYPPVKDIGSDRQVPSNERLRKLIDDKGPFLLMLNCDREEKNVELLLRQAGRAMEAWVGLKLLLIGPLSDGFARYTSGKDGIIMVDSLSAPDLEHAYKNAAALVFPTLSEGFGYPPLEAMKYGTPVLASCVTSLPEVLGDSVLWFSPFYEFELFARIMRLKEESGKYRALSLAAYERIRRRQDIDLARLIDIIKQP